MSRCVGTIEGHEGASGERRLQRLEAGAQGEHKLSRGFVPVKTHSSHWFVHPGFSDAIEGFLVEETDDAETYLQAASEHSPFKTSG
ncbi:MAG: hypothetical protein HOI95_20450 [Chromatiales bacterium]|nr:hypothetical protein [Chromatiales bacterium]